MTINEIAKYLGKVGTVLPGLGSISIAVRVYDARQVYGRIELLVKPTEGSGEAWINPNRITWEG